MQLPQAFSLIKIKERRTIGRFTYIYIQIRHLVGFILASGLLFSTFVLITA